MDDQQAIIHLSARFPLEKLKAVKAAADPSDPDMPLLDGAIARLEAQQAKVSKRYEETKLPEPVNPTVAKAAGVVDRAGKFLFGDNDNGAESRSLPRRLYDQANATAGSAMEMVPGLVPAIESAGDLERTLIPSVPPWLQLPVPGQTDQVIANAPSPTIARLSGAAAVPALGAGAAGSAAAAAEAGTVSPAAAGAGAAAGAANAPASALYRAGTGVAERLPLVRSIPGAPSVVGAGLGAAGAGATDAAIRRIPAAVTPGQSPAPLDLTHDVVEPGIVGALSGIPGGAAENAVAPGRSRKGKMSGGDIARTYAADRYAGKDLGQGEQDRLARNLEDVKTNERARVDREMSGAREAAQSDLATDKAAGQAELDSLAEAGKKSLSEQAGQAEGTLRLRSAAGRGTSKDTFDNAIGALMTDDRVAGQTFDTLPLMDKIRTEVEARAREDTAGTTDETHLAPGRGLASLEAELKGYLKDKASLGDLRNAVAAIHRYAQSGTPAQRYPYQVIDRMVRDYAADVDPTGTLRDINAAYRDAATRRERLHGIVYGDDSEKLGEGTAAAIFDNPEENAPMPAITPAQERRGAKFFADVGSATPGRAEQEAEVRRYGYGDLLDAMEARKREIADVESGAKAMNDESMRGAKAESDQWLDFQRNREQHGTGEDEFGLPGMEGSDQRIGAAENELEAFNRSREASDASQYPGLLDLAAAAGPGALGMTLHGPHGSMLEMLSAVQLARKLGQPLRSRAAYHLPTGEAAAAGVEQAVNVPALASGQSLDQDAEKARTKLRLLQEQLNLERLRNQLGITR